MIHFPKHETAQLWSIFGPKNRKNWAPTQGKSPSFGDFPQNGPFRGRQGPKWPIFGPFWSFLLNFALKIEQEWPKWSKNPLFWPVSQIRARTAQYAQPLTIPISILSHQKLKKFGPTGDWGVFGQNYQNGCLHRKSMAHFYARPLIFQGRKNGLFSNFRKKLTTNMANIDFDPVPAPQK